MTAWALDAQHPFSRDPALASDVRFAWRSLLVLSSMFGIDPHASAARRRKDDALFVRKIWFYLTRPFINGTLLSEVTGYNRSTIEDDTREVETWRRRNAVVNEGVEQLADTFEQLRNLIVTGADFLEELRLEKAADTAKAPPKPKAAPAPPPAKPHAYVSLIARSQPVIRQLGPVEAGEERPGGAMAWAYVDDSPGAQTLRIGWAGRRDILQDALPAITEALRIAGKHVTMAEVFSHPTLKGKYQANVRIGSRVHLGAKPQAASAR